MHDLKSYLAPPKGGLIAGGLFLALGIFDLLVSPSIGFMLFCLVLAALCSWGALMQLADRSDVLGDPEKLAAAEYDFHHGIILGNDCIRMGESYIIGRGGAAVPYDQLVRVYEYIHKTNFSTDRRQLRCETKGGDEHILCQLPLRGLSPNEMAQIFTIIKLHNDSVLIGTH